MTGPLLALDVPWLLYRSFFAIPRSVKAADGQPVGALLGTVNTTLGLVDALAPRVVVCCFGAEEATYRTELYPRYHAHREPMPVELRAQWERAGELLAAFGWTVRGHDSLEADDLLWSCSRVEGAAGGQTLIATGDRDLYQAVDAQTAVLELRRGGAPGTIDADGVRARSGVEPQQIPDLIALRGDPSDGLPGAKGIGAKTAAELLREHGDLEGILAAARGLRPRIAATLLEAADELRAFRSIATLQSVPFERPADAPTDRSAGAAAARQLGMNALARRLEESGR
ncbi:MAG: 5'-3' exonuclease [Solirubrobacteraceae bacterium]